MGTRRSQDSQKKSSLKRREKKQTFFTSLFGENKKLTFHFREKERVNFLIWFTNSFYSLRTLYSIAFP